MILAVDAHYYTDRSQLGLVLADDWTAPRAHYGTTLVYGPAADYRPGEFYRRELPLILRALETIDPATLRTIVVDGYVTLDATGRPGLGQHLYEALGGSIPVVGVAKSYFRGTHAEEVLRGDSKRPLYVTAAGLAGWRAAEAVRNMAGQHRLPDLLRMVDRLSKRPPDEGATDNTVT